MQTHCKPTKYEFQPLGARKVESAFDGGSITSDGGALLLKQAERGFGVVSRFSECFTDYRDRNLVEHTVCDLVSQRVNALALGYEDLNDHDDLRRWLGRRIPRA